MYFAQVKKMSGKWSAHSFSNIEADSILEVIDILNNKLDLSWYVWTDLQGNLDK